MTTHCSELIRNLNDEAEGKIAFLSEKPADYEQYDKLNKMLSTTDQFIQVMKKELKNTTEVVEIIEHNFENTKMITEVLNMAYEKPAFVEERKRAGLENLETKKIVLKEDLNLLLKKFELDVKQLDTDFEDIRIRDHFEDLEFRYEVSKFHNSCNKNASTLELILKNMKIIYPEKAVAIDNGDEEHASWKTFKDISGEFKYYKIIWDIATDILTTYDNYLTNSKLSEIPAPVMQGKLEVFDYEEKLKTAKKEIEIVNKELNNGTINKLSFLLKEKISHYNKYSWIVSTLKSKNIKDPDDWNEIRSIMKNPKISMETKLCELIELNIEEVRADLENLKSKANKRQGFFEDIKALGIEYRLMQLKVQEKKGKVIIKEIDETQILLDDQSNKILNILGNPVTQYDAKLKLEAKTYAEKIKNVQLVLEEIMHFQGAFLYLEPIFSSDVDKSLANESSKFKKVNEYWEETLKKLDDSSNKLEEFMEKEISLKVLIEKNADLALITKKLNDYLNTKRVDFPRFYFVSDEDLMKILAQAKDPNNIQSHLSKCFEGIHKVTFTDKYQITHMISGEAEEVSLEHGVDVMNDKNKGNVEVWLNELEESMLKTIEARILESHEDFGKKKRIEWIKSNWPGQVVHVVDYLYWTNEVTQALTDHQENSLRNFLHKQDDDLRDVVELVRSDISKGLSLTLSGLIVTSVNNRDIVKQMVEEDVNDVTDFKWLSMMRYYFQSTDKKKRNKNVQSSIMVSMVTSSLGYGFEYLGNYSRLVITPLTERCFRTLMGAYEVQYGGAPEGPAGTGKTESVKDLSKAMGIKCNVFNCTEGINTIAMRKFFLGLVSSGCWCCFDEFNRIDTEVLSVIAQQVSTIQDALKAKAVEFTFEGYEGIKIKSTCSINITMNPSYGGRNDLPDNLKNLFRPCAMMVADYYLIAKIKLYSFGFHFAEAIANKVVSSLKLSSEQLSTQSHYDFGMRSLNAILVAAGKIKKTEPDTNEYSIALKALKEVNMPKFTKNDSVLFGDIIDDLFPGIPKITTDLSLLEDSLIATCEKLNLKPRSVFLDKCIQLYETTKVRHALMIVGAPGMGKSSVIKTLKEAVSALKGQKDFDKVETNILNPKSIKQKQLYGYFDPSSSEWRKGLLQVKMVELIEKEPEVLKWLIFDGPVDTLWIENMNSLLDDNKKLCLEDSSSIPLGVNMNIMFEVDDLKEASPATISRNGMVLCQNDTIHYEDLIESYSKLLPSGFSPKLKSSFLQLSKWIIKPVLAFLNKNCEFGVPMSNIHLISSYLNIFETFLIDFRNHDLSSEGIPMKSSEMMTIEKLENLILFSNTIAMLGPVREQKGYHEFLNDLALGGTPTEYLDSDEEWEPKKLSSKLYEINDITEVVFDMANNKWVKWQQTIPEYKVNIDMNFSDIVVPTSETIQMSWLLQRCILSRKHLLFSGNTGTGKTLTILENLDNHFENDNFTYIKMSFTAQTTENDTQNIIEGKLQKAYRKFSPTKSRKGVIFIDDLNMPKKEVMGAQPPIELLRQWMDYKGWYDYLSENKEFINIIDVSFLAAMGNISSGRTISNRYLRHFVVMYNESYSEATMKNIFENVINWFFLKNSNPKFNESILALKEKIIEGTIRLYKETMHKYKATPAKTHYTFNLRDVNRVFQGIAKCNPFGINTDLDFIKLWIHESERVFKDRLVSIEDRTNFNILISGILKSTFRREYDNVTKGKQILFGDFCPVKHPDNDETKPAYNGIYTELYDEAKLKKFLEKVLEKQNLEAENSQDNQIGVLNLVLFPYAIEHVTRIARIINTDSGNALLVGIGGSGRKSLTLLSALLYDFSIFELESSSELKIADWKEYLKALMKDNGLYEKKTIFFLRDEQLTNDSFMEDLNNLLNNGEIPNLIDNEDLTIIKDHLNSDSSISKRNLNDMELYKIFVDKCKSFIHTVLTMSPIGDGFRKRIMTFPSLVNCTTIDWFLTWPSDALNSVAHFYLKNAPLEHGQLNSIASVCVDMQLQMLKKVEEFRHELKRHYYVTPISFIELLKSFTTLIGIKKLEINSRLEMYSNGLRMINNAEHTASVTGKLIKEKLEPELKISKAQSEEKRKEVETLNEQAKDDLEEAEIAKKEAEETRTWALKNKQIAEEKKEFIEDKMKEVDKVCKTIKQEEVMILKKITVADETMQEFAKCLCLLMMKSAHPPLKKTDPKSEGYRDYFEYFNSILLKKADFLSKFKAWEPKLGKYENQVELRDFIASTDLDEKLTKKATSIRNLYLVVRAYNDIYFIDQEYQPAKKSAEDATMKLEEAVRKETAAKEKVKHIEEQKEMLLNQKKELDDKIEQMISDLKSYQQQSINAKTLTELLFDEKKSWSLKKDALEANSANLIGDIFISSSIIAYLGAFTKSYREDLIKGWRSLIKHKEIPISNFENVLQKTLGDEMEIENWKRQGLPNDDFSVDNGIIMDKSSRWNLMIDPQKQANKWLCNRFEVKVEVVNKKQKQEQSFYRMKPTMSPNEIQQMVIKCVSNGYTLFYENAGEKLDTILTPIIKNEYVKRGTDKIITIGKNEIAYHSDFKFYITTNLSKPHYSPEICVALNLVNFGVTEEGLEDQMLNLVVEKEDPMSDSLRKSCIEKLFTLNNTKRKLEKDILEALNSTDEKTLLMNEKLIKTLDESKRQSREADSSLTKQKEIEVSIKKLSHNYKPIALHVAQLFFTVQDLGNIEPVYQYSLNWFKDIFVLSIIKSQDEYTKEGLKDMKKEADKMRRLEIMKKNFTTILYDKVLMSLFEKDKLVFSFMMMTKLESIPMLLEFRENKEANLDTEDARIVYNSEVRFLVTGGSGKESKKPLPTSKDSKWLTKLIWNGICEIAEVCKPLKGIDDNFIENIKSWESIMQSTAPLKETWPNKYAELDTFYKIILIRLIRPDRCVPMLKKLIGDKIGEEFTKSIPLDIVRAHAESKNTTPILFVLSPGADPMIVIENLASKISFNIEKNAKKLSLGQGQEETASLLIDKGIKNDMWIILENCHLAKSFMNTLEKLIEDIKPNENSQFRLFLTAMPSNVIPISIIQDSIKLTNEPPRGIKQSLIRSFVSLEDRFFESCTKPYEFKRLVYGFAFFHALILERRKYGPLGWNIPYEFSAADLSISLLQTRNFLDQYEDVQWEAIKYMVASANYGGRVTDPSDRRLITVIFGNICNESVMNKMFCFSNMEQYTIPQEGTIQTNIQFIKDLPEEDVPALFGLHNNADITSAINETNSMFSTLLNTLPRITSSHGGESLESQVKSKVETILSKIPENYDVEAISLDHPIKKEESLNSVLLQELMRYNNLLSTLRRSFRNLIDAINGDAVMTQDLELILNSVYNNKVPKNIDKVSYPSLKPLSSWVNDLTDRLEFMNSWIEKGIPSSFWISGFFFTQSFLTGVLQNFARKYNNAIDELCYDFVVINSEEDLNVNLRPEDGCYLYGFFIEGASWNTNTKSLDECIEKVLYPEMPYIWFLPYHGKLDKQDVHF